MSTLPKFSVITPSFNQGRYIRETIESVLTQDYPNFEHWIIDGGSTDDTLEVLKGYPHLKVVSEKDCGQSDALNKGFGRATGEIIAWINSDDYYAPGAFHAVLQSLSEYPIVMGVCELIDKDAKRMYQVENVERTWFDLLKYWVPYSIPTQPSIFFKRELLDEFKYGKDSYVDLNLNYVMDYDLWMRITKKYPLSRRIPKLLSYYRMTEENKTSDSKGGMKSAEPEMSKVYNQNILNFEAKKHDYAFILPVDAVTPHLRATLNSISLDGGENYTVNIIDYSRKIETYNELKELISEFERVEINRTTTSGYVEALGEGVSLSLAPFVIMLLPGTMVHSGFHASLRQTFADDRVGLALPWSSYYPLEKHLPLPLLRANSFPADLLVSAPKIPWIVAARKVCLIDLGGLLHHSSPDLALLSLIMRGVHKGWDVSIKNSLGLTPCAEASLSVTTGFNSEMLASVIQDLIALDQREPFSRVRKSFGCALNI